MSRVPFQCKNKQGTWSILEGLHPSPDENEEVLGSKVLPYTTFHHGCRYKTHLPPYFLTVYDKSEKSIKENFKRTIEKLDQ